mmetsp:Transcript_89636/g.199228  ORF Transcript_89636/g.199228 Transcript_89636/m.199228 type:complete len:662 (+) Transcript_89636:85-2070(+)
MAADIGVFSLLQTEVGIARSYLTATFEDEPRENTSSPVIDIDPSLPINSAGRDTEPLDVILLIIFLISPFVVFFILKLVERRSKQEGTVQGSNAETTADAQIQRRGSTFRISHDRAQNNLAPMQCIQLGAESSVDKDGDEGSVLQNVLAGIATAMAALPDAISFSFITGVSPLNGIWAGSIMGLSAALVGGRPGMISSASAATAVVLADVSLEYGMGPMALCVFIVGVLQLIAGALKLSRLIMLVPHSVMLGFVNGLAIVMIRAQMRQYHYHGDGPWVEGHIAVGMTITALFAIFCAVTWARIPYVGKAFPAPLASLILTVVFSIIFKHQINPRTLEEVAGHATFAGGLKSWPAWNFPPNGVNWHDGAMWGKVIATAVRFAIVGILESLMTQTLIDQITSTTSSTRRECFGQGVGNIISSFFGTQGGCALIAQSLLNVGSGGHSRVSGIVMGLVLCLCVIILAPVMAHIPVAALVGLIVLIALNTFAWSSLELILRINWLDALVVVLVTAITVWQDLATAVVVGVIISTFGFAWHAATDVQLMTAVDTEDRFVIGIQGPLFFGSAMNYQVAVSKLQISNETVVLDYTGGKVLDISAVDAIEKARETLLDNGKKVILRGVPLDAYRHLPKGSENEDGVSTDVSPSRLTKMKDAAKGALCFSS